MLTAGTVFRPEIHQSNTVEWHHLRPDAQVLASTNFELLNAPGCFGVLADARLMNGYVMVRELTSANYTEFLDTVILDEKRIKSFGVFGLPTTTRQLSSGAIFFCCLNHHWI